MEEKKIRCAITMTRVIVVVWIVVMALFRLGRVGIWAPLISRWEKAPSNDNDHCIKRKDCVNTSPVKLALCPKEAKIKIE